MGSDMTFEALEYSRGWETPQLHIACAIKFAVKDDMSVVMYLVLPACAFYSGKHENLSLDTGHKLGKKSMILIAPRN